MLDSGGLDNTPDDREIAAVKARLERLLLENIVPAWYPESLEQVWGGFRLNRNISGQWMPGSEKLVVSQARMTWFFARLARFVPDGPQYLKAAKNGLRFLNGRLKDQLHGGYNLEVSSSGLRVTDARKHLNCQTMALMAFSEFARASGDDRARASANDLFRLIEDRAYDAEFPGYRESFLPDWRLLPENETGFLNSTTDSKSLAIHMHLVEAYTVYRSICPDQLVAQRIAEVLDIARTVSSRVASGGVRDSYQTDWTSHKDSQRQFADVRYGRNLEVIWFFIDACESIEQPTASDISWLEMLFDYALKFGFDAEKGGFYLSGPVGERADNLEKIWWVQAEALVSALTLYRLTGRAKYWACFEKTLSWIESVQADWDGGEWHNSISPEGIASGPKSSPWKAAYHNGRAMIECIERLPSFP